jgi:acyl-CoA thioesterase-1
LGEVRAALSIFLAVCWLACNGREVPPPRSAVAPEPADDRPLVVAFGDSLTAGFGVDPGQSYPDYLQVLLDEAGYRYRVVNAGISGDTTSGGLARAGAIAAMQPALVILELGGNDGLRGLPIESTRANLERIIETLQPSGATVVLAGMTLPPNYGPDYIARFEAIYPELAAKHKLPLIPFLLEGVAGGSEFMQNDGIHPTSEGNRRVARQVFETLAPLLAR